jgi:hypothetical protein
MTPTPPLVRFCAVAAPAFLLFYGVLRFVDGLDGHRGQGLAWNVGHVSFLVAFVLLGALTVSVRRLAGSAGPWQRVVADIATVAALFGVACFLWVIVGDLLPWVRTNAALPESLELVGPLLYQVGSLVLLVLLVIARPRRLPVWSPLLVFIGFTSIGVELDLLPLGAVLIGLGLAPLARTGPGRSAQPVSP